MDETRPGGKKPCEDRPRGRRDEKHRGLAEDRLKIWETLFQRALVLIDAARQSGAPLDDWSFGGGTVLMRRHHHRVSKDIDIFVADPQFLGYLSPRLSAKAESMTDHYDEHGNSLKLYFPEAR